MEAFVVTTAAVAIGEIGDGTLGMLCADVPAVLLASATRRTVPVRVARLVASALFAALGAAALAGFGLG